MQHNWIVTMQHKSNWLNKSGCDAEKKAQQCQHDTACGHVDDLRSSLALCVRVTVVCLPVC